MEQREVMSALSPSQVLAAQVKFWRNRRGLSAQALADRVAEAGGGLDRAAIAKIEVGKRGVSLDETLLLAYALAVPPPLLFLPIGTEDRVAITPNVVVHPDLAWRWVEGDSPPMTSDRHAIRLHEWHEAMTPVRLYSQLRAVQDATRKAAMWVQSTEEEINYLGSKTETLDRLLTERREQYLNALKEYAKILARMLEQGVQPPAVAREYLDTMRAAGIAVPPGVRAFEDVYGEPQDSDSNG
jgi:transcriptional regulator with XRE-family HTH domain